MKNFVKKFHNDNSGASIILALVIFVIAAIVCSLIVNAALTNSEKIKNAKTTEQDSLTMDSAVELIKNGLDGDSVIFTDEQTITVNPDTDEESVAGDTTSVKYVECAEGKTTSENIEDMVKDMFEELINDEGNSDATATCEFTIKAEKMSAVTVSCTLEKTIVTATLASYKMTFNFTVDGAAGNGEQLIYEVGTPSNDSTSKRDETDKNTIYKTLVNSYNFNKGTVSRTQGD